MRFKSFWINFVSQQFPNQFNKGEYKSDVTLHGCISWRCEIAQFSLECRTESKIIWDCLGFALPCSTESSCHSRNQLELTTRTNQKLRTFSRAWRREFASSPHRGLNPFSWLVFVFTLVLASWQSVKMCSFGVTRNRFNYFVIHQFLSGVFSRKATRFR